MAARAIKMRTSYWWMLFALWINICFSGSVWSWMTNLAFTYSILCLRISSPWRNGRRVYSRLLGLRPGIPFQMFHFHKILPSPSVLERQTMFFARRDIAGAELRSLALRVIILSWNPGSIPASSPVPVMSRPSDQGAISYSLMCDAYYYTWLSPACLVSPPSRRGLHTFCSVNRIPLPLANSEV